MKKLLLVFVLAVALLGLLAAPAMAAPSHQYPGNVVAWAQYLKGPVPVDTGDPLFGTLNQVGKDVVPINKAFGTEFGYKNYGSFVAVLAQQDK
jgi:hypothetical protein